MSDPAQPSTPPPAQPQPWAPPGAAPFGPPAGAPGTLPAAAPVPQQPPAGWAAPPAGAYAPPAGYAAPAGYPAGPGAASAPAYGSAAPARRSSALGVIALVVAIVTTVGASVLGAIASFSIGLGAGKGIADMPMTADFDWSILSPVRDWVLLGEVSFWVGTALGLWALIQGVIAIVTGRGRGAGIAAVVIAALGPIAFGAVVQGMLTAGLAAGTGIGG